MDSPSLAFPREPTEVITPSPGGFWAPYSRSALWRKRGEDSGIHACGGYIIMSSVAARRGSAGLAGYCAIKGGVRLFAKAVAMECATEGDGIRVNTVHPGVIDTPIWTKLPVSAGSNAPIDPNEVAKAGVPFGRAGQAKRY
jgi:NAD(P)-dependent dehydrogenase (short-subunit alcohol dehydrogenase family)